MERLDPSYVVVTARRLHRRIVERFPAATLGRTAGAVTELAEKAIARTAVIARPNLALRLGILLLIAAIPASLFLELWYLDLPFRFDDLADAVSFFQNGVESLVFLGIAVLFLTSLEVRLKRRRALAALHELHELAHLVDMHQLDKDPVYLVAPGEKTASSPERGMTAFQLHRYLDYCSEMLSLIGKVAALYAQTFADPVALDAADRLESLTTGLSGKIWQKVVVLGRDGGRP